MKTQPFIIFRQHSCSLMYTCCMLYGWCVTYTDLVLWFSFRIALNSILLYHLHFTSFSLSLLDGLLTGGWQSFSQLAVGLQSVDNRLTIDLSIVSGKSVDSGYKCRITKTIVGLADVLCACALFPQEADASSALRVPSQHQTDRCECRHHITSCWVGAPFTCHNRPHTVTRCAPV